MCFKPPVIRKHDIECCLVPPCLWMCVVVWVGRDTDRLREFVELVEWLTVVLSDQNLYAVAECYHAWRSPLRWGEP